MTACLCLTFEAPFASLRIQLLTHYCKFGLTVTFETFELNEFFPHYLPYMFFFLKPPWIISLWLKCNVFAPDK